MRLDDNDGNISMNDADNELDRDGGSESDNELGHNSDSEEGSIGITSGDSDSEQPDDALHELFLSMLRDRSDQERSFMDDDDANVDSSDHELHTGSDSEQDDKDPPQQESECPFKKKKILIRKIIKLNRLWGLVPVPEQERVLSSHATQGNEVGKYYAQAVAHFVCNENTQAIVSHQ